MKISKLQHIFQAVSIGAIFAPAKFPDIENAGKIRHPTDIEAPGTGRIKGLPSATYGW